MYSVVLLAALSAADGSVGVSLYVAYPVSHCPNCGCAYGAPKAGDFWPGYSCWGGCGGYASPAYGVPMTPLVSSLPKRVADPDEPKVDDGKKKKKPGEEDDDEADKPKKRKPKKPDEEEEIGKTAALITIFLPAGAKLTLDGRTVTASGVKTFVTPPLEKGAVYTYEMTIETKQDGKPFVLTRRLRVTAGESVHEDYRELGESVTAKK